MKDRLQKILAHLNISSANLAEKIGVQRSSISHIISGRNKPSFDFILKLLESYNEINAEWLIMGKGSMLKAVNSQISSITESPDLFNQKSIPMPLKNENINAQVPVEEADNILKNINPQTKITNVNKVKQMVLIYEDDTFEIINKKLPS